jgi:hypothetical protein
VLSPGPRPLRRRRCSLVTAASLILRLSAYTDMATDPFHAVQREVQTSLHAAETLRASYRRIRSTARDDSEELIWARNEVCCALLWSVGVALNA